jgi:MotA/TolQ/ExbB proton channel family protein
VNSLVLVLALWGVAGAINLAGLIVGILLWRERARGASAQVRFASPGVIAACTTLVAIALLTTVAGVVKAFGAVGGESVDPSQKARILAEGISEAMNMIALATLVATPVSVAILIYAAFRRSRSS